MKKNSLCSSKKINFIFSKQGQHEKQNKSKQINNNKKIENEKKKKKKKRNYEEKDFVILAVP